MIAFFLILDERDGDEGGIDIDMVEYYEQAMHGTGGFENATSAITAALKDNQVPVSENNTKVKDVPQTQGVEVVNNCHDDDVEMMEEDDVTQDSSHNEPSVKSASELVTIENKTTTEEEESPVTEEEQEKKEEPSSLESAAAVARPVAKPKRSNIRTSWDSPNTAGSAPMIKRSMARRSCNK